MLSVICKLRYNYSQVSDTSPSADVLLSVLFHSRHAELDQDLLPALYKLRIMDCVLPLLERNSYSFPYPQLPQELNRFLCWLDSQVWLYKAMLPFKADGSYLPGPWQRNNPVSTWWILQMATISSYEMSSWYPT